MSHTAEDLARAESILHQILKKVDQLLLPIQTEMRVMAWEPAYQKIMWESVALEAVNRARHAAAKS